LNCSRPICGILGDEIQAKIVIDMLEINSSSFELEGEIFGWPYIIIISKLEGTNLETLWETMPYNNKVVILRELGALIQEVCFTHGWA
jgi:hypothetical protein